LPESSFMRPSRRPTPFHKAHSTELAGKVNIVNGDDRFYNNLFIAGDTPIPPKINQEDRQRVGYGMQAWEQAQMPTYVDGNIYFKGAKPLSKEQNYIEKKAFDPNVRIAEKNGNVFLELTLDTSIQDLNNTIVNTKLLGLTVISNLPFENPDGSPLRIDTDYLGQNRSTTNPAAGPFENIKPG